MSTTNNMHRKDLHWQLLVSVSTAALLASAYGANEAEAADNDSDRPVLWVELGGQLEQIQSTQELFAPPFVANLPDTFFSPLNIQKPPQYSLGEEASISFAPKGSDWVFSASVRYGRSNSNRQQHQQTPNGKLRVDITVPPPFTKYRPLLSKHYSMYPSGHVKLENATAQQSEAHTILDFQAGKDVGLGMFGNHSSSVLSAGVRIAQFTSKTNINLHAEPDVQYPTAPIKGSIFTAYSQLSNFKHHANINFHDYADTLNAQRSFRGVGPSVAWNSSVPFAGNSEQGQITLDWGANAAVLFGRQKVRGSHQSNARAYHASTWNPGAGTPVVKPGYFFGGIAQGRSQTLYARTANIDRVHSVVVPNLGGFVGFSWCVQDFKASFGYRADFFFGAIDGGIDARKEENRGFFGPFASISFGLGD